MVGRGAGRDEIRRNEAEGSGGTRLRTKAFGVSNLTPAFLAFPPLRRLRGRVAVVGMIRANVDE